MSERWLAPVGSTHLPREDLVAASFLAQYREPTRAGYVINLKQWFQWCSDRGISPLDAKRAHIDVFARELEEKHKLMRSTVAHKVGTVAGFYKYAYIEKYIEENPAEFLKRPSVPRESQRQALTRHELLRMLDCAEHSGHSSDILLIGLLGLNGLRVGEATALNLEDVHRQGAFIVINVKREKGNRPGKIPLTGRIAFPLEARLRNGETTGPILRKRDGTRMDRKAAARIVTRLAKEAGITKHLTPHSLRHTFVTLALDAGVNPRDVQNSLGYADMRQVSYYDRSKDDIARNATHLVAAWVEGA